MTDKTESGDRLRRVERFLPPLLAFLAARGFLHGLAAWRGFDGFTAETWVHWDSSHYLQIAQHGYRVANSGWFPLYSWTVSVLDRLGAPDVAAAAVVSALFSLALLGVIWALVGARVTARNLLALFLAAVFPGFVYFHAVMPLSMAVTLSALCLLALLHRRYRIAAVSGALATAAYPVCILLAPVVAAWILLRDRRERWPARASRALAAGSSVSLGFVLVTVVQRLEVGRWWTFFDAQDNYGHSLSTPVTGLRYAFTSQRTMAAGAGPQKEPVVLRDWHLFVPRLQSVLVALLVIAAVATIVLAIRRRTYRPEDGLLLLYTSAFWLAPLMTGTNHVQYRAEVMLVPGVVLLRRLPVTLQAAFVVASVVAAFYFVPLYHWGMLM